MQLDACAAMLADASMKSIWMWMAVALMLVVTLPEQPLAIKPCTAACHLCIPAANFLTHQVWKSRDSSLQRHCPMLPLSG